MEAVLPAAAGTRFAAGWWIPGNEWRQKRETGDLVRARSYLHATGSQMPPQSWGVAATPNFNYWRSSSSWGGGGKGNRQPPFRRAGPGQQGDLQHPQTRKNLAARADPYPLGPLISHQPRWVFPGPGFARDSGRRGRMKARAWKLIHEWIIAHPRARGSFAGTSRRGRDAEAADGRALAPPIPTAGEILERRNLPLLGHSPGSPCGWRRG